MSGKRKKELKSHKNDTQNKKKESINQPKTLNIFNKSIQSTKKQRTKKRTNGKNLQQSKSKHIHVRSSDDFRTLRTETERISKYLEEDVTELMKKNKHIDGCDSQTAIFYKFKSEEKTKKTRIYVPLFDTSMKNQEFEEYCNNLDEFNDISNTQPNKFTKFKDQWICFKNSKIVANSRNGDAWIDYFLEYGRTSIITIIGKNIFATDSFFPPKIEKIRRCTRHTFTLQNIRLKFDSPAEDKYLDREMIFDTGSSRVAVGRSLLKKIKPKILYVSYYPVQILREYAKEKFKKEDFQERFLKELSDEKHALFKLTLEYQHENNKEEITSYGMALFRSDLEKKILLGLHGFVYKFSFYVSTQLKIYLNNDHKQLQILLKSLENRKKLFEIEIDCHTFADEINNIQNKKEFIFNSLFKIPIKIALEIKKKEYSILSYDITNKLKIFKKKLGSQKQYYVELANHDAIFDTGYTDTSISPKLIPKSLGNYINRHSITLSIFNNKSGDLICNSLFYVDDEIPEKEPIILGQRGFIENFDCLIQGKVAILNTRNKNILTIFEKVRKE